MKFVKNEKIGEGAYPKTCALFPENVDDFLEVERRGNKVAGSLFYFIDLRSEFPMLKYGLPTNHFETVQLGVVDPPLEGLP